MKELEAAAGTNGVKPGAQMSRFLLWVGNECYEGREIPDLMVLTSRAKDLAKMFLAQDQERCKEPADSKNDRAHLICQSCGMCSCTHERGYWIDESGQKHFLSCDHPAYA